MTFRKPFFDLRRQAAALLAAICALTILAACGETPETPAGGLREVSFATDWKAQAEHGGFYQAQALGFYEARGLSVTIVQGGPGVNVPQLIAGGAVDMGMGSNSFIPLNMVEAGVPAKAVMASFQKDPQVLITHPRDDVDGIADMKGKPIMIADATIGAFWQWLRAKYGFTDDQIRKYNYNLAPFLTDPNAIQQGYLSSEPYAIEQALGTAPEVYLLADEGYPGYAAMVLAPNRLIAEEADVVAAFVEASIAGWRSYLRDDPEPAHRLIRAANPEITEELLTQARAKLIDYGIVAGDGTARDGLAGAEDADAIGRMTEARWRAFFETMAAAGVYPEDLAWRDAYTTEFVE
jgi:NitT/TauT family transport system substrate-binding protein